MQSTAPQKKQRHAKAQKPSKGQMNIRQVQLRLKSEGLFKGKVTGKMDRQTRLALTKFEKQNGMPKTASLVQVNRMLSKQTAASGSSMPRMTRVAKLGKQQQIRTAHLGKQQQIRTAHMMRHNAKSQTSGVGSSMPNTKNANAPQTNPAPAGAGGTTSPTPSNAPATSTPPSGTPANK
jgi:hypothetical protein